MNTLTDKALKKIEEIETELRRINRWASTPPAPEKFQDMGAFGSRTLSPEEWIQFILCKRVRDIAAKDGQFPNGSNVGTWAVRNFDGDDEADHLVTLLCEFDQLFD